jgi:2-oxoacid:acceptor oxidoreductase gamma subunit (pyruvate/2-ketoisovalerate family)
MAEQAARKLPMFQVRIHGRGGQGVVTGAEMLSVAAFFEERHAQAFPSFGSERMGAPVVAFCRIADKEIRLREPILEPDCLIVQDPTLFKVIDVFAGIRDDGYLLVNTNKTFAELLSLCRLDEPSRDKPAVRLSSISGRSSNACRKVMPSSCRPPNLR